MNYASTSASRLFVGTAILVAGNMAFAQPQVDARVRQVLADWQKRQEAVDTVRYEVKGQRIILRGSLRDDNGRPLSQSAPGDDIAGDLQWTVTLDLVHGRHRREISEQIFDLKHNRFHPRVTIDVCNGKLVKSANPRDKNTTPDYSPPTSMSDLIIMSGNLRPIAFGPEYMPLFFAHGIVRTAMAEVVPGKLRGRSDADYFVYHGEGAHHGRRCVVIRTQTLKLGTTSFEEFWTDPARQSAIVRYVMYSGKRVFSDVGMQYEQTTQGWLPTEWTFTSYSGLAPSIVYRMRVESRQANLNVAESDFDLPALPGMRVEEIEFGETLHPLGTPKQAARVYQVDDRGRSTEVADVFSRPQSLEEPRGRWRWVLSGFLALGIIASAAALVNRSRKGRRLTV